MPLVTKEQLLKEVSPPLDGFLVGQLIDEFTSLERRYVLRDWEPAELDGGQFAEIAARIVYHHDSGTLNLNRGFNECMEYVIDEKTLRRHVMTPRSDAIHICKVLQTAYKFRSQRGAVHISPNYGPNQMDARLVLECVRWAMSEILRIFWQGDRNAVAKAIREIQQFEVPCIGRFEDVVLVQRTDLAADQELLLLLHHAGDGGMSRTDLGRYAQRSASTVTNCLSKLTASNSRQVMQLSNSNYRLTDLGMRRVLDELSSKLTV